MPDLFVSSIRLTSRDVKAAEEIQRHYSMATRAPAIRKAIEVWPLNQSRIRELEIENGRLSREIGELRQGLRRLDQSLQWIATAAVDVGSRSGKPFSEEEE